MDHIDLLYTVDFIGNQDGLFPRSAEDFGYVFIHDGNTLPRIHNEQDNVCFVNGKIDLLSDLRFEYVSGIIDISPCVDHRKLVPVPIRQSVMPVPGNSTGRIHDSFTLSHQAVEESTFTHIRAANDCYDF